jgi:hypothetical protein
MSDHAVFSPSSAERWIRCPGSMGFNENLVESDAGVYADEGTAAHSLASRCLQRKVAAYHYIGEKIQVDERVFEVTEEFADHVQTYVDDVARRAMGGYLMVEQRVHIAELETFGTSDGIIASAPTADVDGEIEDLKFGRGEAVYAWSYATEDSPFTMDVYFEADDQVVTTVEPNYQLMLYALGSLPILLMLLDKVDRIRIVINQPRLGSISELVVTKEILERFALYAFDQQAKAKSVLAGVTPKEKYLKAGEKQCRWCKAPQCPARDAQVAEEVGAEFEVIEQRGGPPTPPTDMTALSRAFRVIPFIRDWIKSVEATANTAIVEGREIIGIDKKPMKFVEGKAGNRAWNNEKQAETALLGVLVEADVYQPKKIISASVAAKKLDKKKTAAIWTDVFVPLISRASGRPMLVLGSDPRPAYVGAAKSDEFDEITTEGDD